MTTRSTGEQRPTRDDLKRFRENYQGEIDGVALYEQLADAEKDPERAGIFRELAETERRHVKVWEDRLRAAGEKVPKAKPSMRVRFLGFIARRLNPRAVLPMVSAMEAGGFADYMAQEDAGPAMARDERSHARALEALSGRSAMSGPELILRRERWHRSDQGGQLRAAIFGVNDGLVSNLSLVIGVAGANPDGSFIILAGVAGLLAGAFSMGAGEFISVTSQRELFERQIALEKEELETDPDEERMELALIYRAKGLPRDQADDMARKIIADPNVALETLAREELGLNPDELGSPVGVSLSSFAAFASGAIIPLIPWLFGSGWVNFGLSLVVSGIALFGVGAGVSLFTGRHFLFSGVRQLGIGAVAAAITYSIGRLIGVSTA